MPRCALARCQTALSLKRLILLSFRTLSFPQDWVTDQSTSVDLVPVANGSDPSSSTAVTGSSSANAAAGPSSIKTSATLSAAVRAELMKKTIIQPSDPEVAARPCPICKEAFKGDFEEEEEEWVWHNAVEEDGVVSFMFCLLPQTDID